MSRQSLTGTAHKEDVAKAGTGTYSKSAVVDGKWKLVDEGNVTYAEKSEGMSLKNGVGEFHSSELSGSYHRSSEGKWNWEWAIYDGKTAVTGDAKLTSSGSSNGDSNASGNLSFRDTTGQFTYNDGFSGSDETRVEYTYDPTSEKFLAKSGSKVTGKTSASADANYDGTGVPESGSGSITYHFDWKQKASDETTWSTGGKYWSRSSSGTGEFKKNTKYDENSGGTFNTKHGLSGNWSIEKKDSSNTNLNWTTAYSDGMQNDSGSGTLKGKISEVSTRGASGTYASGATSGSYSEDKKTNRNGKADISLTREKNGDWTSNGTVSGSSSGNTDWSDKSKRVTGQALFGGTVTTTTETDTGRHYEYDMSTTRKLRVNTWSAYEGLGTGKGNGWDYLTVTIDGSYSFNNSASDRFSSEARDYIIPYSFSYILSVTIKGSLSDKLDYKYDDTFNLTSSGWTTSTIGNGTRKITDDYSWQSKGSGQQSGFRPQSLFDYSDFGFGDLTYNVSASLDFGSKLHSETEIVFDWTNDGSSVTEQTKKTRHLFADRKIVPSTIHTKIVPSTIHKSSCQL